MESTKQYSPPCPTLLSMIPWLTEDPYLFPHPDQALEDPDGLLAAGGDLTTDRLLQAYRQGIFPWFGDDDPILWWSPNPRCVIKPDQIHISRSLKKHIRRSELRLSFDENFTSVIQSCSKERSGSPGTWITEDMKQAYINLHYQGFAHSVEVWDENRLIGGLYGLAIGPFFFGESMFSVQTNASKVAFVALGKQLKRWNYQLIDCQVHNSHLESLGATDIPRAEFLRCINLSIDDDIKHNWNFDTDIAHLDFDL